MQQEILALVSGTSSKKSGGETNSSDSDTEENASASSSDSSDDSDIRTTSPMTLVDSEGNTIEINYILHKDYSYEYREMTEWNIRITGMKPIQTKMEIRIQL